MKKCSANNTIDLDTISHIIRLDGRDMLESAVLTLHKTFNTFCTSIVEKKRFQKHISPIAFAQNNKLNQNLSSLPKNMLCNADRGESCQYCAYTGDLFSPISKEAFAKTVTASSYVAIPIRTQDGEVMGVLFSTFSEQLSEAEQQRMAYFHQMFADLTIHALKELWFSERSDQLVNQLSYEVSHDSLTGLLNRSSLSDTLESITQQSDKPFTLAFLDIDNFKSINDINGNYIGDKIIKFTADSILTTIPEPELAFRIAGDEFAFITYSEDPIAICDQILRKVELGYNEINRHINFKVSIGIARAQENAKNVDNLILNTSLALKDCKKNRDIQIQCYDTHLSAQYHRKNQLVDAIRTELSSPITGNNEVYVVVQPIVSNGQSQWDYFEVLTRWNSPEHGFVSPVEFIHAAEQSGLIVELGERIIELACIAKQQLEEGLGYKVKFGLNCSAHELNDSARYLRHLTKTIKKHGFKAHEFVIELTETVLLTQAQEVREVLCSLRNMGFTVALDDFGTGYSSLNYIHSYPIDCIKIDATFIRNLLSNDTSESVVWLIIKLAQQLKVKLVAEGVEHQEELEKLHAMGCSQIQGYYYSRPEKPEIIINSIVRNIQERRA